MTSDDQRALSSDTAVDEVGQERNLAEKEGHRKTPSSFGRVWFGRQLPKLRWVSLGFLLGAVALSFRPTGGPVASHAGGENSALSSEGGTKIGLWTCSMHPQVKQGEFGSCSICGMDLVSVHAETTSEDDGPTRVTLSERAKTLAKLRTSPVRRSGESIAEVRLLGRVEPNETTLKMVTAWTGGRIDRLYVNTTGEKVRGGQVIAKLYSPEVFAAHQDLISASAQVERMVSGVESSRLAAKAARNAVRQRLSLLGVPDGELAKMETQKTPATSVSIRTPFGGTVMERFATEGTYVTTGARLYSIANLRTLWIQLDAYESDLSLLSVSQTVRVEVEAFPGEEFEGKITFIDPTLDPRKRTARVRVEVDNKEGRLRPGMFAQAIVAAETEQGDNAPLIVPSSAPLFTGRRAIIYVEVSTGERTTYEARTVRLGPRLGKFYPVVAGLSEGERIVIRGAFALDADLQIRGGASMMSSPDDSQPGQWDDIVEVPRSELKKLAPIVREYLLVQRALGEDNVKQAQSSAERLQGELEKTDFAGLSEAVKLWKMYESMLGSHALRVAKADSIEEARTAFEGLSGSIVMLLRTLGNPLDKSLSQAFCPMAAGSQGATWIQEGDEVFNPYFGASMLECGDVSRRVEPGAHLVNPAGSRAPAPQSAPMAGHKH